MKAWLITLDWDGDHAKVENPVVAILNPRISGNRIREIVEFIYVNEYYSFSERIAYAKSKNNNPYPAAFFTIEGVAWEGAIICGHNPFLFARRVEDLQVKYDKLGGEQLTWREDFDDEVKDLRERIHKQKSFQLQSD